MENVIYVRTYESPCGSLLLGEYDGKLCLCDWMEEERRQRMDKRIQTALQAVYAATAGTALLDAASVQLDEYFAGTRKQFTLPLLQAGSPFRQSVWDALVHIPYGTTCSYAGLASCVDRPRAVRAVAAACGANALSIFVPCHRVVGAGGSLTGYAGGVANKQRLLELEREVCLAKSF